ncbi:MAG: phosphatase PAP2 family protein [Bacteroidales bacterium]|nr:phosphatase PAP2 family protein [Bacteroidales bacterium]
MDIGLFERVDSRKGLFAVEKISLIYNILTTILIFILFTQLHHPLQMLVERVFIATITLALMYFYRFAPCKATAFVRIGFQMALLAYWYPDTFEFNRIFPNLDHVFATIEQGLFGFQPAVTFHQNFSDLWISELFNLGYFFYYPMIAIVALYYFIFKFEYFEKFSFVIVTSFFLYYIIFILIPVAGPQFYFPAIGFDNVAEGVFPSIGNYFNNNTQLLAGPDNGVGGFFYGLVEASQRVGERPTAAFPSSHVGISTILMIMSWRLNKKLFTGLLPLYLLLCGATVYIQAHYLIDVFVGFISAFGIYVLSSKIYTKWFAIPMFKIYDKVVMEYIHSTTTNSKQI